MASDAAVGFLQGIAGPLEAWAEGQNRLRINRDARAEIAADKRASNSRDIAGSASLLADKLSGSEEQGEAWTTIKNNLTKYANHNPSLLTNIRKDIAKGSGRYTFGDSGPKGSINIIGKLWRSPPPSQAETTLERKYAGAAEVYNVLEEYSKANPKVSMAEAPTLSILTQYELGKMGVQEKPTTAERRKAIKNAMRKRSYYQEWRSGNFKDLKQAGVIITDPFGNQAMGEPNPIIANLLAQSGNPAPGPSGEQTAEVLESESSMSNLWGLLGDDTPPLQSLQDLNLDPGQVTSVNSMLSQIADYRGASGNIKVADRRRAIERFLSGDSMTQLPDDRRQAVQKLLEAAFN
tara:strand:+ start:2440 stop:3486 length:1047 start_codon:yes stop_codon:yes gene_type:complete